MTSAFVREPQPWGCRARERVMLLALSVIGVTGVAAHAAAAVPDVAVVQRKLPAAAAGGVAQQAFGVHRAEGELWGGGPRYKVRFDAGGIVFTPALGRAAPRNFPLALQADSMRRGTTLLWSAASGPAATPQSQGTAVSQANTIRYALQPGLTERFDVERDGLEQSFVLDAPPPGVGDLIVRLSVQSELQPIADGEGLRFDSGGFGGVRYGGVTGIDADGRRATGSVRVLPTAGASQAIEQVIEQVIELSLPADFVATARYPLVVDPVISPFFPLIADPNYEEAWPDMAYERTSQRYFAVWEQIYSLADFDIRGQMLDASGEIVPFDPDFGTVIDLGGNSPGGGFAGAFGASLGNENFTHTYQGLSSNNPVLLIIDFLPLQAPICSGELVPDPNVAFILPMLTDPDNAVMLVTPIPNAPALSGLTLYEQWVETDTVNSPCGKNIQLSNGLAVTLE